MLEGESEVNLYQVKLGKRETMQRIQIHRLLEWKI